MDDREVLIILNMIPAFGMKKYEQIIKTFGCLEVLFKTPRFELKKNGLSSSFIETLWKLKSINPQDEIKKARKAGIRIVTYFDENYPKALKQIFSPPLVLYFKGEYRIEDHLALSLVGSRRPSIYGRNAAEKLAGELAKRGITIVSGLARGIDSASHQGALKAKGRTIAVLGSGLGRIYPPENVKLAEQISKNGLLVSEFPYNSLPFASHFPRRNRLISAFSLGTVIIEAAVRSGALITANFALEQGKEVFAVPGRIDSPTSAGTHRLIRDGAKMVIEVEDILEEFRYRFPDFANKTECFSDKKEVKISDLENKVFSLITKENDSALHIDELIRCSQLNSGEVAGLLFKLELKGLIKQLAGKRFIRIQ